MSPLTDTFSVGIVEMQLDSSCLLKDSIPRPTHLVLVHRLRAVLRK